MRNGNGNENGNENGNGKWEMRNEIWKMGNERPGSGNGGRE